MKICPRCGQEQPDAFSQCLKCRHIFSPANVPPLSYPTASSAGSGNPSLLALAGSLVAALALAGALWWLNTTEGTTVLAGSYTNDEHHFAVLTPSRWTTLTPENYQELFEKLGSRFPPQLQQGLAQRRIAVGFMDILEQEDFSPSINIVVVLGDVPDLDESQKREATETLSAEFARMLDNYKMEESEFTAVDGITGLRFVSTGSMRIQTVESQPIYKETIAGWRTVTGHTPAEWKDFQMRFVQTLVPGKGRAYIITASSLESQYAQYRPQFENALRSFRVLERPPRFGSFFNRVLQFGFAGALVYLLFFAGSAVLVLLKR